MFSQDEILAKVVKLIIKKVIQNSTKSKSFDIEKAIKSLKPEVVNTLKKLIIETKKQDPKRNVYKKIKARFISIESMFQFGTQSPEFYPYGMSFIDPLVLQGKLYILSQLSNIIMKLSRAAPVRKWIIDVGPLQNQSKYVQQIKRELYNQKVTIDDIMSFKSAQNCWYGL